MTVIGIGGCMGLIVVGFGLQDSITAIAKNQFVNLFTYQASAVFNGDATEEKKARVQSEMETYPGIQQILEMYCQSSIYMTVKWVLSGMKSSSEELARMLVKAMPARLEKLFTELDVLS